jgi:Rad3-related DNA helicase
VAYGPDSAIPTLPNPPILGLPAKFHSWRAGQAEAVAKALDSPKRFVVLAMPTGFGKSLVYMAASLLGERAACLTSTKGLQNQLMQDFGTGGSGDGFLVDIRGMNNYECLEAKSERLAFMQPTPCDEGPCTAGYKCDLAEAGCLYFDAQRRARNSDVVVTNYAYWMAVNERARSRDEGEDGGGAKVRLPLGKRGMLVLDEAHAALDELANHLTIEMGNWEIEGVLGEDWPIALNLADWKEWAGMMARKSTLMQGELSHEIKSKVATSRKNLSRLRELRNLARRLQALVDSRGEWVEEASRDRHGRKVVRFDPVWPGEYSESELFLNTAKVVLTSATVRPKTLELLGIKEGEYDFVEYPSSFPVERRPVVWVRTVKVSHKTEPGGMRLWASKIGAIVRARSGAGQKEKGIVHTVSYARQKYLVEYADFGNAKLHLHESAKSLQETVRTFKSACGPAVLISPSVSTGFDFPMCECSYQIISKVPFPDTRSKILAARASRDPEYFAYVTAQQLVQACGRGMRSADDWCQTIIVDDNIGWFVFKYKKFFPKWWLEAYQRSETIPPPLTITQSFVGD